MSSPAKSSAGSPNRTRSGSPGGKKGDPAGEYEVGPAVIENLHNSLLGADRENDLLSEEFFNLMTHDRLRLESEREIVEERKEARKRRLEEKRKREEEKRLWEMRNNPENLGLCAAQIQKVWRRIPLQRDYERLRASLKDLKKKRAVIIIADEYEDSRVRVDLAKEVIDDAHTLVQVLQAMHFAVDVYSYATRNPKFYPTKANVSAALAEASSTPADTLLWVHVVGLGGTGTVHGRNPFKAAEQSVGMCTPRTRLLRALTSSHATGKSSTTGDVRRFVFPSDARSSRLSFESVIANEEVLDVLHPRHSECIHGRAIHQRLVTVDVADMGDVEGHAGGGYALLASSCTPAMFFDMPDATHGSHIMSAKQGVLSRGILNCLLGEAWTPEAGLYAPDGSPRSMRISDMSELRMSNVNTYIEALFEAQGVRPVTKPIFTWGDFPILAEDRGAPGQTFMTRAHAAYCHPFPTAAGNDMSHSNFALDTSTSATNGPVVSPQAMAGIRRRRNGEPRQTLIEVTIRLDMNDDETRVSAFDPDFATILTPYLHILSQPDMSVPLHRQPKITFHRILQDYRLTIGIEAGFVEVAARCKVRGTESTIWDELLETLIPDESRRAVDVCIGRTEEGSVALVLHLHSQDEVQAAMGRVGAIPSVLGGIRHSCVFLDVKAEVSAGIATIDHLTMRCRNITPIVQRYDDEVETEGDDESGTDGDDRTGIDAKAAAAAFAAAKSPAQLREEMATVYRAKEKLTFIPYDISYSVTMLEGHLDTMLALTNVRRKNWITVFAKQKLVRVHSLTPVCGRINDYDDHAIDALMRRERPMGSPVPYTHTGSVVVMVGMSAPHDQRSRQARELQRVAANLEVYCGFRFLLWDIGDALRTDPHRGHNPRDRLNKLLEAIKFNIGPSSFPALVMLDLIKKRYYRMRQQVPSAIFDSKTITSFCEEFLRGTLGELLPPVKGSRVFGGGISSTKFALIPV